MPESGSGSTGMSKPIARAIRLKHSNPLRRHNLAGMTGAALGDRARNSAAESSTASSEVTQDDIGCGDRKRVRFRYVVWLSATSAAQRSHSAYRPGIVSRVDMPDPSP